MSEKVSREQAVTVAYLAGNTVFYSWHRSMVMLLGYDRDNNRRVHTGGYVAMRPNAGGLVESRNDAVKNFLADDKSDWLFWIDSDMGFAPDTVDRLFEAADPADRPIVGGLCFFNREDYSDGMGGHRSTVVPTIYDWVPAHEVAEDGQRGWKVRWRYPIDTVTRAGGTGAACILIHRSVFEKMAAQYGAGSWYDRVPNPTTGQLIGEDLSFCLRAGAMQIPVHVHTGVQTTHAKQVWLAEEDYVQQVALSDLGASFKPVLQPKAEEA